jgi:serine protease AprX
VTTLRRLPARSSLIGLAGLVLSLVPSSPARAADLTTLIVTYSAPPTATQLDVLKGVTDAVHGFQAVPAAVVVVPSAVAPLLRELPGVRGVYPNTQYQWLSTAGDLATGSTGASTVWQDLGWTGAGVGIGIIDAGVDGTHPDLCAAAEFCNGTPVKTVQNVKVVGRQDVLTDPVVYLENQVSTDSSSGHGSHVAGIAAGWGSAGTDPTKYRGVAYGANLIGFGTGELVEADNVLGAFDYAISHRDQYNIKVLNNSWGTGAFTAYDPGDPVNLAIDTATADGIAVVFGAGNDGTRTDSLNMFALNPNVISAGSGTKDHQQSFFSSKGVPGSPTNHPTVTTPGDSIVSVRARTGFTVWAADAQTAGGGDADTPATGSTDELNYATSSGTSMAAPHLTGVIALMQQAAHTSLGRWLTPVELRNILQNTATPMPGYQTYSVGAGFVNAYAATQAAAAGTQTQTWVDPTTYDVTPYAGTISTGTLIGTTSFTSTHVVQPGATILDVMADWGPEKVLPANTDVDIDLIRPDGTTYASTFLACNPAGQPNGYSSYCTSAPNERLTVVNPVPGTWTVSVHAGLVTVNESVRGLWSVGYPRGTALPATAGPASVTVDAGALATSLAGQAVSVTATVRDASGLPLPDVPVSWSATGVGSLTPSTTTTDSFGRVRATAMSTGPGSQVVSASAAGLTGSATITWLGVAVPSLPCLLGCTTVVDSNGKASVGGWYVVGGARHRIAATGQHNAGSTTSSGELSFDDRSGTQVSGTGVEHFVLNGNQATITGTATVNGTSGYRYSLVITDNGEPGTTDTVSLTVTQPGTTWQYSDSGTLGGGNAQVQAA